MIASPLDLRWFHSADVPLPKERGELLIWSSVLEDVGVATCSSFYGGEWTAWQDDRREAKWGAGYSEQGLWWARLEER